MSDLLNYLLSNEPQFKKSRLPSLYSDFKHLKSVNPDGYDANISAWRSALADAVREGLIPGPDGRHDLLSLNSGEQLLEALETKEYGQPVALGAVLNGGIAKRELIPRQTYFTQADAGSFRIWDMVKWGIGFIPIIGASSAEDRLPVGQLVVMDLVRDCAKKILLQVSSKDRVGRIWPMEEFKSEFARCQNERRDLTDADFDVVLYHLATNLKECDYDRQTVKFRTPDEPITPITHEETTIASLKQLISSHETQIATLTRRIDELAESAKAAISKKNRAAALSSLRSKKLAETALTARAGTLAQLEEVLDKIHQAADHVQLVNVMQASTGVLRSLHRRTGGVERVEDVVDELREEMSRVDEVGQVIGEVGKSSSAAEEGEVEDELEALEREEREREEGQRAAETRRRLAALERDEAAVREREGKRDGAMEKRVDEQTAGLSRMSLEEDSTLERRRRQGNGPTGEEKLPAD